MVSVRGADRKELRRYVYSLFRKIRKNELIRGSTGVRFFIYCPAGSDLSVQQVDNIII